MGVSVISEFSVGKSGMHFFLQIGHIFFFFFFFLFFQQLFTEVTFVSFYNSNFTIHSTS